MKGDDDLGRSLQKARTTTSKRRNRANRAINTTNHSIIETSDLASLLLEAELADRNFEAERNKTVIFEVGDGKKEAENAEKGKKVFGLEALQIPRRPKWNERTTPAELARLEKQSFLEWRRKLAKIEENQHILITPYEKNLEIWRQLWRVVENSDLLLQIVDARNPLLYYSQDLEKYVGEVSSNKRTALVLNKADLLTSEMRQKWSEYFLKKNIRVVFFSAKLENTADNICGKNVLHHEIMSSEALIDFMKSFRSSSFVSMNNEKPFVVGLVGYPNVGKSSTINSLLVSI